MRGLCFSLKDDFLFVYFYVFIIQQGTTRVDYSNLIFHQIRSVIVQNRFNQPCHRQVGLFPSRILMGSYCRYILMSRSGCEYFNREDSGKFKPASWHRRWLVMNVKCQQSIPKGQMSERPQETTHFFHGLILTAGTPPLHSFLRYLGSKKQLVRLISCINHTRAKALWISALPR